MSLPNHLKQKFTRKNIALGFLAVLASGSLLSQNSQQDTITKLED